MGTQKNRLIETVLLSIQNMFKLMGKKITNFVLFCLLDLILHVQVNNFSVMSGRVSLG